MIGSLVAKLVLTRAFRALNNRNLNAFLGGWHQDAQFHYTGDLKVSGTVIGKMAVRSWFENMLDQYPQIHFSVRHICVENLMDLLGNNTIAAQVNVNLTNKDNITVTNSAIVFIRLKFGKVVEVRDYFFYPERLAIGWGES